MAETTLRAALAEVLPSVDDTDNHNMSDVIGNKNDTIAGTSIVARALAAVTAANAAVLAAQAILDRLEIHSENETLVFPDTNVKTVTLQTGNGTDVFTVWTEIADSAAGTLTTVFAATTGYIREVMTYTYSQANKRHIIELAYGTPKVVIGRVFVMSDWTYTIALNSVRIPAGQTVYYRMSSEFAGIATLKVCFRYYFV